MPKIISFSSINEWREARRAYLGASDVGVVLGVSPFATPFQLWAAKVHGAVTIETPAMRMGTRHERTIIDLWNDDKPDSTPLMFPWPKLQMAVSEEHPFMSVTPDALVGYATVQLADELGELKTGHKPWRGAVPDTYVAQARAQMIVLRKRAVHFAMMFSLTEYEASFLDPNLCIGHDDEIAGQIIEKCAKWWRDYVVAKVAPPITDPLEDLDSWRKLHTKAEGEVLLAAAALPALTAASEARNARLVLERQAAEIKKTEDAAKAALEISMDSAQSARIEGTDLYVTRKIVQRKAQAATSYVTLTIPDTTKVIPAETEA